MAAAGLVVLTPTPRSAATAAVVPQGSALVARRPLSEKALYKLSRRMCKYLRRKARGQARVPLTPGGFAELGALATKMRARVEDLRTAYDASLQDPEERFEVHPLGNGQILIRCWDGHDEGLPGVNPAWLGIPATELPPEAFELRRLRPLPVQLGAGPADPLQARYHGAGAPAAAGQQQVQGLPSLPPLPQPQQPGGGHALARRRSEAQMRLVQDWGGQIELRSGHLVERLPDGDRSDGLVRVRGTVDFLIPPLLLQAVEDEVGADAAESEGASSDDSAGPGGSEDEGSSAAGEGADGDRGTAPAAGASSSLAPPAGVRGPPPPLEGTGGAPSAVHGGLGLSGGRGLPPLLDGTGGAPGAGAVPGGWALAGGPIAEAPASGAGACLFMAPGGQGGTSGPFGPPAAAPLAAGPAPPGGAAPEAASDQRPSRRAQPVPTEEGLPAAVAGNLAQPPPDAWAAAAAAARAGLSAPGATGALGPPAQAAPSAAVAGPLAQPPLFAGGVDPSTAPRPGPASCGSTAGQPAQAVGPSGLGFVRCVAYYAPNPDDPGAHLALTVHKGEILERLPRDDDDETWVWARNASGREGLAPRNYVTEISEAEARGGGLTQSSSVRPGLDASGSGPPTGQSHHQPGQPGPGLTASAPSVTTAAPSGGSPGPAAAPAPAGQQPSAGPPRALAVVEEAFDGSAHGEDFLAVARHELVRRLPLPEDCRAPPSVVCKYEFAQRVRDSRKGWLPARVLGHLPGAPATMKYDCPGQEEVDGEEYLALARGTPVERLDHPQNADDWTYVRVPGDSREGWVPTVYLELAGATGCSPGSGTALPF